MFGEAMRWRRQIVSRRSSSMLPLMLIHAVNEYRRLQWKPPVTAGLLAANTLIYLRPGFLDRILPSIDEVWFNAHVILKQRDLKRFFLSAFYHLGESHLVYNMMSLLWKGTQLEISMGSVEFASMVASLLGLSQGITLLLAKSLTYFDYNRAYYHEYAVGFSGVLFAMKVVLNSQSESYSNVQGFVVPARYAAWAELILIQLLVPDASFLGHLGGILAGIVYMRIKSFCRGPDPLTIITRGLTNLVGWPLGFVTRIFQSRNGGIHGRGRIGRSHTTWRCGACTFDNSGWLSVCEVCGTSRSDDEPSFQSSNSEIPLDELRHRRIQRFGR